MEYEEWKSNGTKMNIVGRLTRLFKVDINLKFDGSNHVGNNLDKDNS